MKLAYTEENEECLDDIHSERVRQVVARDTEEEAECHACELMDK